MSPGACPRCGHAAPAGSRFCAYCGRPLGIGLLGASQPPPGAGPRPGDVPPGDPARHRHRLVAVIVAVVILGATAASVFGYIVLVGDTAVQVRSVSLTAPDNDCGLAVLPADYATPFSGPTGSLVSLSLEVPNHNLTSPCTVRTVRSGVSGFDVVSAQVPFTVAPGGTGWLNLTLRLPPTSYTGPLTLFASGR
ncbi:MAG: zinc ribbon domain-containing protein [Thermoplasmata archaeon]